MAVVRPYRPSDLPALYDICLQTADNGADGTHLYLTGAKAADIAEHPELRAEITRMQDLGFLAG